jgi:IS5 family transposase
MNGQHTFFNVDHHLAKIYQLNGFLPKLNDLIDWELFRPDLQKVREKERLSNAGRPPFDVVFMFKVLILKNLYNLSDEKTEEFIRDRLSFQAFLGLTLYDRVPDAKTIWFFAEQLKNLGIEEKLFDRFDEILEAHGFAAKSGNITDGSFVEVPKQRNTKEENEQIKNGEIPATLSSNPHVLSQKDTDAEWAKKGDEVHFGYKDHVVIDDEFKFIRGYGVTGAATHDSVPYLDIIPLEPAYPDQEAFADSAYKSQEIDSKLTERGFVPEIHEKGYRGKPLTAVQKESNKVKSSVRCRVEHVFGEMKMRMGNEVLRSMPNK